MTQILDPVAAYALWAATYPPRAHNAVMMAEERAMRSLLPKDMRGLCVIDVGCGTGRYLQHALDHGVRWAVGLDLSYEMLIRAIQHYSKAAPKKWPWGWAKVTQAATTQMPMRNNSVDMIICALTLGHVELLGDAVRELGRVLKPNGLLVCSDFHPIGATLGWQRTFKHEGQRFAVQHFTHHLQDWQAACEQATLNIETCIDAFIDPIDVPAEASFDRRALELPVAHAFVVRKPSETCA